MCNIVLNLSLWFSIHTEIQIFYGIIQRLFILSLGSIKYIVSSFWENILLFILSYYPMLKLCCSDSHDLGYPINIS